MSTLARYYDRFMRWLAPALRPARPWLHVTVSPRVACFLVAAGCQPGPTLTGEAPETATKENDR